MEISLLEFNIAGMGMGCCGENKLVFLLLCEYSQLLGFFVCLFLFRVVAKISEGESRALLELCLLVDG